MKAFLKTLVGDARNAAAVCFIVGVAAVLTALDHPGWAAFAMPAAGLAVVFWLARQ